MKGKTEAKAKPKAKPKAKAKRKAKVRRGLPVYDVDFWVEGPDALDGLSPLSKLDRVGDALHFASERDAFVSVSCGRMHVSYTRKAPTQEQALASALADFHKAGLDLKIVETRISELPPRKGAK